MCNMSDENLLLEEVPLTPVEGVWSDRAQALTDEALRRAEHIDCFDFVPSQYPEVARVLAALPRGCFCEWGRRARSLSLFLGPS